ncbi:MarR family winged helix-turn-helix transcriptional regulator [Streptomyces sp. YS-3]|uniref:MarR family winged helix-turn-helix transcriptional regulator n=1 Tax=Streptomyces sp. YS-3 TaxID=3381352 RepID=UPI0038625F60
MAVNEEPGVTDPPAVEGLQRGHGFLLCRAAQTVMGFVERDLSPLQVTMRQFDVLDVVAAEPGLSQRAVGERLRIHRMTIVSLVDKMEGACLMERRRGPDRRTVALHPTERGLLRLREAQEVLAGVHREFLHPLSAEEREALRTLLVRLVVCRTGL